MTYYKANFVEAVGNVAWFDMMGPSNASQVIGWDADKLILQNSDGSRTYLWHSAVTNPFDPNNLNYNAATNTLTGTINYITRTGPTGIIEYENIGGFVLPLTPLGIDANTFWTQTSNAARFNMVFGGTDLVEALNPLVTSSQILGGGAGPDFIRGGIGVADTVDYRFSQGGVTVNWLDGTQNTGDAAGDTFDGIENLNGSNFADNLIGNALANVINGGGGDDVIDGAGGVDILSGGDGNDRVMASAGDTYLYGGTNAADSGQHDVIDFLGAVDPVFNAFGMINFVLGANGDGDVTYANTGHDIFTGFEHVWGTELIDEITGNAASNILGGRGGNDRLIGLAGQDQLFGGGGDDFMRGGANDDFIDGEGNGASGDVISWNDAGAGIIFTLGTGGSGSFAAAGLGTDTYVNIEGVEGSNFVDNITGNSSHNVIYGMDGGDSLFGAQGNDTLVGGAGNDFFMGGAGNDTIYGGNELGGNGADVISFRDATGAIAFTLSATGSGSVNLTGVGLGIDTYFDITHVDATEFSDQITGNGAGNLIFGHNGSDDIRAGGGADEIFGDDNDDYLQPGAGGILLAPGNWTDTVHGGSGNDILSFFDIAFGQVVTLGAAGSGTHSYAAQTIPFTITHSIQYDGIESLGGSDAGAFTADQVIGADNLTGNNIGNRLFGFWGNDTLSGLGGNDSIDGGAGSDNLLGGTGNDEFNGVSGTDTIDGGADFDRLINTETELIDATIVKTSSLSNGWRVSIGGEVGHLTNVESAEFIDATVTLRQSKSNFNFGSGNDVGATSDILLQNGGNLVNWTVQGSGVAAGTLLGSGTLGWTIRATGDTNADGDADIIMQNGGNIVAWNMQNGSLASAAVLGTAAGWTVVGAADINNDGDQDVLLQNGGTIVAWTMQNGAVAAGALIGTGIAGWTVAGTGDFFGDGSSDILLQNGGSLVIWDIDNGAVTNGVLLGGGLTGWSVKATGDLNNDGTTDLVLQNGGTIVDWIINNGAVTAGNVLGTGLTGWNAVASGDYNGDGTSDILLQNGGDIVTWTMTNGLVSGGVLTAGGATGWLVVA